MQTALITGITGMVGSHLADYLLENTNWQIIGLARWRSPLDNIAHLIPKINENARIKLLYGDIKDSLSLDSAIGFTKPDYVFHLAAQSFPKTSFISPIETMDTNIQGTVRVLEALKKYSRNAQIHICSSSEIFGRVPKDKLPISEDCSFHPASPYAISKAGCDLVGRFYAEAYEMNVQVTRMFTHTGPRRGDVFAESSFAKQIALIEAGYIPPIVKVGNLNSLRTIADVRDAVEAYYKLLTVNPVRGSYYNIGGNRVITVQEILEYLISLSHKRRKICYEVDPERLRPIDADLQVPDTSKFRNHTGWEPKYSFEETMTDLLEYWRNRVSLNGNIFLNR